VCVCPAISFRPFLNRSFPNLVGTLYDKWRSLYMYCVHASHARVCACLARACMSERGREGEREREIEREREGERERDLHNCAINKLDVALL
jgi:hypothetical protein